MRDDPGPGPPALYAVALRDAPSSEPPWLGVASTVKEALTLLRGEWRRRHGPGVPGTLVLIAYRDGVDEGVVLCTRRLDG